jgi:DNA-damage-inducible protein J
MMDATIQFRTGTEVKKQAEAVFRQLGMSMSEALNIFLRQVIIRQGFPFEVTLLRPDSDEVPNNVGKRGVGV